MSNRRRPTDPPTTDARWSWLFCPDCASVVHEVHMGQPPDLVLSTEVEHSTTCPADREDRDGTREIALQFLPHSMGGRTTVVRGDEL